MTDLNKFVESKLLKSSDILTVNTGEMPAMPDYPMYEQEAEWQDTWQARTLKDAYEPREPIQYAVEGLFSMPSLGMVYGSPGDLKSFLLADMAICAAAGLPWLPEADWQPGVKPFKTKAGPVIWIDFDNGRRRTDDRFAALGRARDLPEDTPLAYYSMPTPGLDGGSDVSIAHLTQRIISLQSGLVVIDNLKTITGGADENSAAMGDVMYRLRRVAEDTGAAVVVIHHQRKSNGMQGGRAGDALRGHGSIEAALDLALIVDREPYSDDITLTATKSRGETVYPFGASFTFEIDQAGSLIEAKFYGRVVENEKSDSAFEKQIRVVLLNTAMNQSELIKAVKQSMPFAGNNRILAIIKRLEKTGKLKVSKGDRNILIYSLP